MFFIVIMKQKKKEVTVCYTLSVETVKALLLRYETGKVVVFDLKQRVDG